MLKLRQIAAIVALAGSGLSASAFTVAVNAGEKSASYSSSEVASVYFSPSGYVTVTTTSGVETTYDADEFTHLSFADVTGLSTITSADKQALSISVSNGIVTVSGCDSVVDVYNVKGSKVASGKGGTVDVSSLPAGVYVVAANGLTEKLLLAR